MCMPYKPLAAHLDNGGVPTREAGQRIEWNWHWGHMPWRVRTNPSSSMALDAVPMENTTTQRQHVGWINSWPNQQLVLEGQTHCCLPSRLSGHTGASLALPLVQHSTSTLTDHDRHDAGDAINTNQRRVHHIQTATIDIQAYGFSTASRAHRTATVKLGSAFAPTRCTQSARAYPSILNNTNHSQVHRIATTKLSAAAAPNRILLDSSTRGVSSRLVLSAWFPILYRSQTKWRMPPM